MENVIISNPKEFELKKKNIIKKGFNNLHIISDFDRTLTKAYLDNGEFVPSLISILRDENYLTPEYPQKAKDLFNTYHKIEINPKITLNEKKKAMEEWWTKHSELFIKSKLNKTDIKKASQSKRVRIRNNIKEIFKLLEQKEVPIVILSANGLGNESCIEVLKYHNILLKNVNVISNQYI
jgi:5'-nucleotidase